jgi:hypothetical protein
MTLHDDLHRAITTAIERTRRMHRIAQETQLMLQEPRLLGRPVPGWFEWVEIETMMAAADRGLAEDLAILQRHAVATLGDAARSVSLEQFADVEYCPACRASGWPCEEVLSLAQRHAVEAPDA